MKNDIKIIHKEFSRSDEARYIHRLHGVLIVLLGQSTVKAGKLLGVPQRTIAHWTKQFKKHSLDGLKEDRTGRPEILSANQKQALMAALAKSPKDIGMDAEAWTNKILLAFVHKRYGIKLNLRHGSRLLAVYRNQVAENEVVAWLLTHVLFCFPCSKSKASYSKTYIRTV